MLAANGASRQFAIASPKSAMWRVCGGGRRGGGTAMSPASDGGPSAPRRVRTLVEHNHPGEPLAVAVRDEDLEARVRLLAARKGADVAERRHAGAPEEGNARGFEPCSWPNAQR